MMNKILSCVMKKTLHKQLLLLKPISFYKSQLKYFGGKKKPEKEEEIEYDFSDLSEEEDKYEEMDEEFRGDDEGYSYRNYNFPNFKKELLDDADKIVEEEDIPNENSPATEKYYKRRVDKLEIKDNRRENTYLEVRKHIEKFREVEVLGRFFDIVTRDNKREQKGKHPELVDQNKANNKGIESLQLTEVTFAPLSNEELTFVKKFFTLKVANDIIKGGKDVLKREILALKKESQSIAAQEELDSVKKVLEEKEFLDLFNDIRNYEPLNKEEHAFLSRNFQQFMENFNCNNLILNQGKNMVKSLKNLYSAKTQEKENLIRNIKAMQTKEIKFVKTDLSSINITEKETPEMILIMLKYLNTSKEKILQSILKNKEFISLIGGKKDKYEYSINDISLIKGLSSDPINNLSEDCYNVVSKDNYLKMYGLKGNLADKGHILDTKSRVYEDYRIIIRVTVKFFEKPNSKDNLNTPELNLALFDNELILPTNKVNLGATSYPELFNFYHYKPELWKLIDINDSTNNNGNLFMDYSHETLLLISEFFSGYFDENIAKLNNILIEEVDHFKTFFDSLNTIKVAEMKAENEQKEKEEVKNQAAAMLDKEEKLSSSSNPPQEEKQQSKDKKKQKESKKQKEDKKSQVEGNKSEEKAEKGKEKKDDSSKDIKSANLNSSSDSIDNSNLKQPGQSKSKIDFLCNNYHVFVYPRETQIKFKIFNIFNNNEELKKKQKRLLNEYLFYYYSSLIGKIHNKDPTSIYGVISKYKNKLKEYFNDNKLIIYDQQEKKRVFEELKSMFLEISPFSIKGINITEVNNIYIYNLLCF